MYYIERLTKQVYTIIMLACLRENLFTYAYTLNKNIYFHLCQQFFIYLN